MTGRRIESEQRCTTFGDLDQERTSRDVAVDESLAAESLLQLVQLDQLHGQRAHRQWY